MITKKLAIVAALGLGAWWVGRKYQDMDSYLLRVDDGEGSSPFLKASLVFGGLDFGESIGMNISLAGLAYLKDWEGAKRNAAGNHVVYIDSAGLPTIGYGHLIKKGESFNTITEAEAGVLLAADVADAESIVNKGVKVKIHQYMFDAMVAFAFNWPKFRASSCLKKINASDWAGAFNEWRGVVYVTKNGKKVVEPGLVKRREKEILLFKEGLGRM